MALPPWPPDGHREEWQLIGDGTSEDRIAVVAAAVVAAVAGIWPPRM